MSQQELLGIGGIKNLVSSSLETLAPNDWEVLSFKSHVLFSGVLYKPFSGKAVKKLHKRSEADEKQNQMTPKQVTTLIPVHTFDNFKVL